MRSAAILLLLAGVFAEKFYLKGTFEIPYANVTQPIEANVDGNNYVWSFFNGLQTTYYFEDGDNSKAYLHHVRKDHMVCSPVGAEHVGAPAFVPDYKGEGWKSAGRTVVRGIPVEKYVFSRTDLQKVNHYEFYVTASGVPVRFVHLGHNDVFGSHYDIYVLNYEVFRNGYNTPGAFEVPDECKKTTDETLPFKGPARLISSILSSARGALTPEFSSWMSDHQKSYGSVQEALVRQAIFQSNVQLIESHNSNPERSYTMVANKFADMTPQEIIDSFAGRSMSVGDDKSHEKVLEGDPKPAVDWRISLAPPVKDQCSCGSCWTFSTVGSIEGRYNIKRLQKDSKAPLVRLSEQNVVNCFWSDDGAFSHNTDHGCYGGEHQDAFHDLIEAKTFKMALEADEPYLGVDAYCHPDIGSDEFTPSKWFTVPVADTKQLKLAVEQGPVAVALRVPMSFAFYGYGVYKDEICAGDLVHAVTLDGYMTDPLTGKEVWIVRNSWSSHWGSNGYIYIEIEDNDCSGLTQSAAYVEF